MPTPTPVKPMDKAKPAAKPAAVTPSTRPAPPSKMPESDPLVAVLNRNTFYRDGYRWVLMLALGEAAAILFLILIIVGMVSLYQPNDRYFATTSDGRLIPMVALSEPNLDSSKIITWANTAATQIMTFGFHDYRQRLTEAQGKYFTDEGWASFTKALERSRVIESVEGSQQVVTAAPQGAATIVQEGVINGIYTWTVQLPLIVTYMSGSRTQPNPMMLTLRIVRVPTYKNPEGIGIQQWLAG